jgi:hypothetical protein
MAISDTALVCTPGLRQASAALAADRIAAIFPQGRGHRRNRCKEMLTAARIRHPDRRPRSRGRGVFAQERTITGRPKFDTLDDKTQLLALAAVLEKISGRSYGSLDEWAREEGRSPQQLWDAIMHEHGLPASELPDRLRAW